MCVMYSHFICAKETNDVKIIWKMDIVTIPELMSWDKTGLDEQENNTLFIPQKSVY